MAPLTLEKDSDDEVATEPEGAAAPPKPIAQHNSNAAAETPTKQERAGVDNMIHQGALRA